MDNFLWRNTEQSAYVLFLEPWVIVFGFDFCLKIWFVKI